MACSSSVLGPPLLLFVSWPQTKIMWGETTMGWKFSLVFSFHLSFHHPKKYWLILWKVLSCHMNQCQIQKITIPLHSDVNGKLPSLFYLIGTQSSFKLHLIHPFTHLIHGRAAMKGLSILPKHTWHVTVCVELGIFSLATHIIWRQRRTARIVLFNSTVIFTYCTANNIKIKSPLGFVQNLDSHQIWLLHYKSSSTRRDFIKRIC